MLLYLVEKIKMFFKKKLTEESNSDSLLNMEAIVKGFAPVEQYDIIKNFLVEKFFEVLPKLGKNNEYQLLPNLPQMK